MNDFDRCNKVTGVYWLKSPLETMGIKVRLKSHEGIKTLPQFDTYKNDSNKSLQQLDSNKLEDYEFEWQEKVFSLHEIQRYSNIHSCISETDLSYHDMLDRTEYTAKKVFTYIHKDHYVPLPLNKINETIDENISNLSSCFKGLHISDKYFKEDTSSMRHLFRSEENVSLEEKWQAMHIVYDNSEYNEDSQLLLKQEILLLSIYYNSTQKYLILSPDVNNLDLNPYQMDVGYEYAVELVFERGGDEVMMLLQKLSKKWEKKHKQLIKFVMPPLGKRQYFVTLELLSADEFDLDNLYVEFNIKVPNELHCSDRLHGRTHMTKCYTHDGEKRWSFGHLVELHLEAPAHLEPPPLKLFFEVISTDWWDRHRTEGYCYLPLTLEPGRYSRQLSCSRPEELDPVEAETRRFFVGGCHLIKDLEVLANPQLQDANFKFTTAGVLSLRWSTVTQVSMPGFKPAASTHQAGHATAVLKGAETALRHYSRARARLAAATKDLETNDE